MTKTNLALFLFACFALGLPLWGMQVKEDRGLYNRSCTGQCYQDWQEATGGAAALAAAKAQAKAEASPEELGKQAYAGCVACHGAGGEGGIGPALAGRAASEIAGILTQYKNGETRGGESALMWSQAGQLSDADIDNLASFIESL